MLNTLFMYLKLKVDGIKAKAEAVKEQLIVKAIEVREQISSKVKVITTIEYALFFTLCILALCLINE